MCHKGVPSLSYQAIIITLQLPISSLVIVSNNVEHYGSKLKMKETPTDNDDGVSNRHGKKITIHVR